MSNYASSSSSSLKPIAFIFYPLEEDNVFNLKLTDTRQRIQHLSHHYEVHTFQVKDICEAYNKAISTLNNSSLEKCEYMELAGHGSSRGFCWISGKSAFSIDATGEERTQFQKLINLVNQAKGMILLHSCEAGLPVERNKQNLLQYIASIAKAGIKIFGASEKLNGLALTSQPHRVYLIRYKTGNNITRIYQKTFGDRVQHIPLEHIELLFEYLRKTKTSTNEESIIHQGYEIFSKLDRKDLFQELIKANPELSKLFIAYLHAITVKKEKGSIWGEMLDDLENLSETMGWTKTEKVLSLTPENRGSRVTEEKGCLKWDSATQTKYEEIYKFILSLSAVEMFAGAIIALDNNKSFLSNPGAQSLFALTGTPHHSSSASTSYLIPAILSTVETSYLRAKDTGTLQKWFENAFGGVCFDEKCQTHVEYAQHELVCTTSSGSITALSDIVYRYRYHELKTIITMSAEWYVSDILKRKHLENQPQPGDQHFLYFCTEMFLPIFCKLVQGEMVKDGRNVSYDRIYQEASKLNIFQNDAELLEILKDQSKDHTDIHLLARDIIYSTASCEGKITLFHVFVTLAEIEDEMRKETLKYFVRQLMILQQIMNTDQFEAALANTSSIPEEYQVYFRYFLLESLCEKKQFKFALDVAKSMPNDIQKECLKTLFNQMLPICSAKRDQG